ncbi:MAG: SWIM zinc finger family protein [Lachnospiraceae bacterium]|nr:SWIM zinc finger family protein [Lachnospiraceae bacterium]
MNWKNLFSKQILDRGYQYYLSNAVRDYDNQNNILTAEVDGTERYEVEITIENEEVVELYCSCPHAGGGNYCKHMAAVRYHWQNEDNCKEGKAEKKETVKSVEQLVNEADETVLRHFLVTILKDNNKLRSRFELALSMKVSNEDMKRYKREIDATVDEYSDRSGYVSYRDAFDLCCELDNYLHEDAYQMLENGEYIRAFELTNYVLLSISDTEMDDSDGGIAMLLDSAETIWNKILDNASEEVTEGMFQWFTVQSEKYSVYYLDDSLENIIMERFKEKKYLSAKLEYVEKKIKKAEMLSESWSVGYQIFRWVMRYIDLMLEAGENRNAVRSYCKKYWEYADIRKYYAKDCVKNKEFEEAIAVYKESILLDADAYGLVQDYSVNLKEIYHICGMEDEYRKQLWELVTKHATGHLEYYRELKALHTSEEWLKIREEIFALLGKNTRLDDLFVEEKLYDRLLASVIQAPYLFKVRQYAGILKQEYPDEILQKYTDELYQMVRHASTRKQYQEWVKYLKEMKKIKGGEKKVQEILEDWKVRYKNRPAMLEELRRL